MNMQQLKNDMKDLQESIREVKGALRSPWTRPMGAEQHKHLRLKREITELYILRAWLRGKSHLDDVELCKEIAEKKLAEYQLQAA
jgi:hypothetical protein